MKYVAMLSQLILGLAFFVFGLNGLLPSLGLLDGPFIQPPPMEGAAADYMGTLTSSGILLWVKIVEVVGGALMLASLFLKRYAPLATALLAPVVVNILLFHLLLTPLADAVLAIVLTLATLAVIYYYWEHFRPLFEPHVPPGH